MTVTRLLVTRDGVANGDDPTPTWVSVSESTLIGDLLGRGRCPLYLPHGDHPQCSWFVSLQDQDSFLHRDSQNVKELGYWRNGLMTWMYASLPQIPVVAHWRQLRPDRPGAPEMHFTSKWEEPRPVGA